MSPSAKFSGLLTPILRAPGPNTSTKDLFIVNLWDTVINRTISPAGGGESQEPNSLSGAIVDG